MNRRSFLQNLRSLAILPLSPRTLFANASAAATSPVRRRRPTDPDWPSQSQWKQLNDAVGGNLLTVESPLASCAASAGDCTQLFRDLQNPYYIGDTPGLTQTLGWVDAWTSKPSVYAVAARSASDISAAVNFARQHHLRLVVKGGGHSYQGTSNAPDSLLIWTRHMHDVELHDAFIPQGCKAATHPPQRAVTIGAGAIWNQAYDAVTTKAGAYVQGGGCTTVGVAGLIQSGGFGSFSKHYGTAASALLQAEVVTADGKIRIVNPCLDPDLFWALKGGGGGSFAAISKLTLRVRDLPEFAGGAEFQVQAASDDAYRRLIRQFVSFYRDALFNDHWGEQAHFSPSNILAISMVFQGLTTAEARAVWQPFLDWLARFPSDYSFKSSPDIGAMPMRHWWDPRWRQDHDNHSFKVDPRSGADPSNVWWNGDGGQVGFVLYAYESLWIPASLLHADSQDKLAAALFSASRHQGFGLHFNKGLAGAPAEAIAAARDTATNPAVCDAFALAISGDGQGPAYPGIPDHEPDAARARPAAERVHLCMNELRAVSSTTGAYVSESNFFESDWQHAYWGANFPRLAAIKQKYDPTGLFFTHNGVGSDQWSPDGFTKL